MPLYDFKCHSCEAVSSMLVPSNSRWRKHRGCGGRMERLYPLSFNALNTTSANGDAFKSLDIALGCRVSSVGEQSAVMKEIGCYPADSNYHAAAPATPRKEISEKELGECLRDINSLGTV